MLLQTYRHVLERHHIQEDMFNQSSIQTTHILQMRLKQMRRRYAVKNDHQSSKSQQEDGQHAHAEHSSNSIQSSTVQIQALRRWLRSRVNIIDAVQHTNSSTAVLSVLNQSSEKRKVRGIGNRIRRVLFTAFGCRQTNASIHKPMRPHGHQFGHYQVQPFRSQ